MPIARVMVVDDEPQIVAVLGELLAELGYATRSAMTGPEALRLVAEFQPDVVLLDLALPEIRGEIVLEQIHRTSPHVPVIMVTGNDDPDVARRTLAQGAFDYIAKPFTIGRLQQVLEAALAYRD
jgi:CheY-like chemotaxis protein